MNLIIVESPTKAKTLNRFLGKDYSVEATLGHIMDLPKSKLGVDVKHDFKPDYVVVEKREEEIQKIKEQSKKAKKVYIATDPDREGEAIAQHVNEILRYKDTKILRNKKKKNHLISKYPSIPISRIVFHEITKEAVEEAIKKPRKVDKNLVNAQIGRRVLDRLVGYKLSPILWKKVRRGLSAGRVQTVAVRLIVEKEREIKAFKKEEYWEVFVKVSKSNKILRQAQDDKSGRKSLPDLSNSKDARFFVKLVKVDDKKVEITDGKSAKKIVSDLKKSHYKVFDVRQKEVSKSPYPPFTTSTMTQAAARLFGWSAKRTMSIAQRLYEKGLITYHRTDSTHLAAAAVSKLRNYIDKEYGAKYLPEKPRFFKVKSKVAQEAHEAIRPTNMKAKTDGKGKYAKDREKLYKLIWKRFVACQMTNCIFDQTTIDVDARTKLHATYYMLRASGQVMKFDGWRKVIPLSKGASGRGGPLTPGEEPELPLVEKDESLQLIKVDPQQKFTQPPARFNEASLIKTLEMLGIGRPSTYAPVITTIRLRQYVEKDEGKFKPTPVGFAVNDFMIKNFPEVFDYQFTAEMEDDLDNVANGKRKWVNMMKEFYKPFKKKLESVEKKAKRVEIPTEKLGKKCPKCKSRRPKGPQARWGELVVRIGRFGKFISCSRFPDCDYKERYVEKIGMKCPKCKSRRPKGPRTQWGDVIIKKTGKGRKFFGCSRYPECKWASWKNPKIKEDPERIRK